MFFRWGVPDTARVHMFVGWDLYHMALAQYRYVEVYPNVNYIPESFVFFRRINSLGSSVICSSY